MIGHRMGGLPFAAACGLGAVVVALGLAAFLTRAVLPGAAPHAVRTIREPGVPTRYVVDLSAGRTLQCYLDPGAPGFNGIHATFFDAQGRELEVARVAAIGAGRPGGATVALPVLQEGPGHFYSDFDFRPGEWRLDIVAATRTGEILRAHLTIRL